MVLILHQSARRNIVTALLNLEGAVVLALGAFLIFKALTTDSVELAPLTGEFEVALLVRGDLSVVEKFIARIDFAIEICYACVAPKAGEVTLELLNRLDQIELTRATTTFA